MNTKLISAIAACALILSACATPTHPAEKTDAPASEATQSAAPDKAQSAVSLPDPHSLTGLSTVADLEDPTPVEGNFPQKLPITLTDFEGNQVTVTDTSRILALDLPGTISRTIIGLGYGDKLVGRTSSSTEKQLADLPVVTENGHTLNAEAILALQPTLIIADRSVGPPEAIDQLRASGIPVVLVNPAHSIDTIADQTMDIAHAVGADDAGQALVKRTEKSIAQAREQIAAWTPNQPLDTAFLYVRGTAGIFFILGEQEGATALIEAVGAKDVASANGIRGLSPANAESLVKLNPEVIFVMSSGLESANGIDGLLERPGVSETRAGGKQRFIAIPDGLSLSFGPQTGEALLAIARALYGVEQ